MSREIGLNTLLSKFWHKRHSEFDRIREKIMSLSDLAEVTQRLKLQGKRIVLCHGAFDLLHPGHLRHLSSARKHGDILLVTVTSDKYVKKGPGRPVFNEQQRAEMLASLAFTDYVSIIDFPGAVECIKALKPHFYVKGPDYRDKEKDKTGKIYLEESAIESVGGRLIFTEDITLSSTLLIRKNSVSVIESTELLRERINDTFSGLITALDGIESSDISGRKIGFVEAIQSSITLILFHASMGKKIILIGNGGSASICSHLATDYTKNAGIPALAFNDPVFLTAISNDFGFDQVFVKLIESFSQESDIVIAISSSGESENIIKGVNRAKEMGCKVITFSGFNQGNRLRAIGDFNFYIPENKYGLAEIAHMTINHFIADLIINK